MTLCLVANVRGPPVLPQARSWAIAKAPLLPSLWARSLAPTGITDAVCDASLPPGQHKMLPKAKRMAKVGSLFTT